MKYFIFFLCTQIEHRLFFIHLCLIRVHRRSSVVPPPRRHFSLRLLHLQLLLQHAIIEYALLFGWDFNRILWACTTSAIVHCFNSPLALCGIFSCPLRYAAFLPLYASRPGPGVYGKRRGRKGKAYRSRRILYHGIRSFEFYIRSPQPSSGRNPYPHLAYDAHRLSGRPQCRFLGRIPQGPA